MNRLPLELDRLYGLTPKPGKELEPGRGGNARSPHGTRVAVLSVAFPAGWGELSAVWRGVQSDLELPAPAIAVSGTDSLQLWFSFASPTTASSAGLFLDRLRARYLPDISSSLVRACVEGIEFSSAPGVEVAVQRWSAYITKDLASVFADTPWLDIPPGDEGQATILRGLASIQTAVFEAALNRLGVNESAVHLDQQAPQRAGAGMASTAEPRDSAPARFLSGVMNDETAPLALRIEAARILLSNANSRDG